MLAEVVRYHMCSFQMQNNISETKLLKHALQYMCNGDTWKHLGLYIKQRCLLFLINLRHFIHLLDGDSGAVTGIKGWMADNSPWPDLNQMSCVNHNIVFSRGFVILLFLNYQNTHKSFDNCWSSTPILGLSMAFNCLVLFQNAKITNTKAIMDGQIDDLIVLQQSALHSRRL